MMMNKLHLVCAGTSDGSVNFGCESAPRALLHAGLGDKLTGGGWDVRISEVSVVASNDNYADLGLRNAEELIPWLHELYRQLSGTSYDEAALAIGGDHSIAAVSLLATKQRYKDAVCVYVDAHPDAHTLESSQTRNFHGLPLRVAAGQTLTSVFGGPYFDPAEIFLVGIKDVDSAEAAWLEDQNITRVTMDDIIERGIGEVMGDVIKWVRGRPVHISYDIDAVDAMYAPGTGIQNVGGLTYREATYIARQLGALCPVAVDLVEVNPLKDENGKTVRLAQELVLAMLGGRWDTYQEYLTIHKS
jgi:arginase